jgi:3'(2'), 5'-bisphosphate nucleotidase
MFGSYQTEVEFSLKAVREAAELASQIQRELVSKALVKSDRSPVTVADFTVQALIARRLADRFPGSILVAEESSQALRSPDEKHTLEQVTAFLGKKFSEVNHEFVCTWIDYGASATAESFWTLDPVDGTKGFLRGEQYVTALALIQDGQVQLGALGCPHLSSDLSPTYSDGGVVLVAARGYGVWLESTPGAGLERLEVSRMGDSSQARVLRSVESGHTDLEATDRIMSELGTGAIVPLDSQAKFALLAGGKAELIFRLLSPGRPNYREKIWDQAAGSIIVEEAGGRVSDLRGEELNFGLGRELTDNIGVLVSNGLLHDQALQAINAVGADQGQP